MTSQFQMDSNQDHDQLGYDLDGNANLVAVLQVGLRPGIAVEIVKLKSSMTKLIYMGAVEWESPSSGLHKRKVDDDITFAVIEPT